MMDGYRNLPLLAVDSFCWLHTSKMPAYITYFLCTVKKHEHEDLCASNLTDHFLMAPKIMRAAIKHSGVTDSMAVVKDPRNAFCVVFAFGQQYKVTCLHSKSCCMSSSKLPTSVFSNPSSPSNDSSSETAALSAMFTSSSARSGIGVGLWALSSLNDGFGICVSAMVPVHQISFSAEFW